MCRSNDRRAMPLARFVALLVVFVIGTAAVEIVWDDDDIFHSFRSSREKATVAQQATRSNVQLHRDLFEDEVDAALQPSPSQLVLEATRERDPVKNNGGLGYVIDASRFVLEGDIDVEAVRAVNETYTIIIWPKDDAGRNVSLAGIRLQVHTEPHDAVNVRSGWQGLLRANSVCS